jgi:hypothetical protein
MDYKTLINYLQTANINFLIGSGASCPLLETLGDVEVWLTKLAQEGPDLNDVEKKALRASIYKAYFDKAIVRNLSKLPADRYQDTIKQYVSFLSTLNEILNRRGNRLTPKQVNLFTTNVDTLIENAAEEVGVEFNDGFKGSVKQIFDETNFRKSISKTSLHFQSVAELPVFNLYKVHGSINWEKIANDSIGNDYKLAQVKRIVDELAGIAENQFIATTYDDAGKTKSHTYEELKDAVKALAITNNDQYDSFLEEYDKLIMVNPTKQKFQETVMDIHFYELMRLYSNSLEKENSILFVTGFSFADEHIANLTMRAANSNPTLQVIIFAFDASEIDSFKGYLKIGGGALNSNVKILTTKDVAVANKDYKNFPDLTNHFTMSSVVSLFSYIRNRIPGPNGK